VPPRSSEGGEKLPNLREENAVLKAEVKRLEAQMGLLLEAFALERQKNAAA